MGSDERHFNVLLTVRDKVTSLALATTFIEENGETTRNRAEAPLLTSLTPYRWAKPANKASTQRLRRTRILPTTLVQTVAKSG